MLTYQYLLAAFVLLLFFAGGSVFVAVAADCESFTTRTLLAIACLVVPFVFFAVLRNAGALSLVLN